MTPDYTQASAFIAAIGADIVDFRAIHDTDKGVPANTARGTLADCWQWITAWNAAGYGIFAVIAEMDGRGLSLANTKTIRAHYVDLDEADAQQQYERASAAYPAPWFAVQSSPGKFHVYWPVIHHAANNDRFNLVQRKLRQTFNGDKAIIDPTRVMRLPGTIHQKDPTNPHMVHCWALAGYGQPIAVEQLETALASVNVIDGGDGMRYELGDPELAAPSLDWIKRALELSDPNELARGEWIPITAAIKQAGWSLTDPDTLYQIWSDWCARYAANDLAENMKQWNSIRNSQLGWPSLLRRVPSLNAANIFGGATHSVPSATPSIPTVDNEPPPMPEPPPLDCSGEFLTHLEQKTWFAGCVYVVSIGKMMVCDARTSVNGRFLDTGQFNAMFGGKKFIVDGTGKQVNEPWQAATRSTLWTVPKVDHTRFYPRAGYGDIIMDDLKRKGINTYNAIDVRRVAGDASPFINHLRALLATEGDVKIMLDYLAHNVKYPGHKIPWAPVIQSGEGAGKGVLKRILSHGIGRDYMYFPNAKDLSDSGAKFNGWMRNKLFILADEIKVDDRLDLIEVLKPMISEDRIEIQSKGQDQTIEDNYSNWLFFSNWKNAIPINKNGRRFAIMYSPLQTIADMLARGMNDAYFKALYDWLDADGCAIVADYLMNYPIERGAIPMRAPDTSSTKEALDLSRGPLERMIADAVEDGIAGFRGGWISTGAVAKRIRETGAVRGGTASATTIAGVIEGMGYTALGRAPRAYFAEDRETRPYLFFKGVGADMNEYGKVQGWE